MHSGVFQWALLSRAAAPYYFEAHHLLHDHCIYKNVLNRRSPIPSNFETQKYKHNGQCPAPAWDTKFLGPGLVAPCPVKKPQSRTAVPLLLFDVGVCQIPILPIDNSNIQRDFWPLKTPSFPEATIADFHSLDLTAARAVYDLKQSSDSAIPNVFTFAPKKNVVGEVQMRRTIDFEPVSFPPRIELHPKVNETSVHARTDCVYSMIKELRAVNFSG